MTLFPTQEVGSLRKPFWLVEGLRGKGISAVAEKELAHWSQTVPIHREPDPRAARLDPAGLPMLSPADLRDLGSLFGLRYLEKAGLDIVYDGEMRRVEMYEYPVRQATGFEFLGHVRSFDNKYYLKAACVGEVGLRAPYHVEEFQFIRDHAKGIPKVPVTGAYTLADWSWNEYYLNRQKGWKGRAERKAAQREFAVEIARKVVRPTLRALADAGAKILQIDEPAAGTHPDEADLVAETFNESTQGVDAKFVMHICFSDYRSLFPAVFEAKRCSQFLLEFANRDRGGIDGYEELQYFADVNDHREVGVGVLDIHRDEIETPELVAQRVLRAAKILKDPAKVYVNPDCGLRTRSLDVAWKKLTSMVEGTRLARSQSQ